MKRQIRNGVFETNSSSTHSLVICSEEEFEAWEKGELLFRQWEEEFVKPNKLSVKEKEEAEEEYNCKKCDYWKDWNDLTETEKESWYAKYALNHKLKDYNDKTYNEYMNDYDLESYVRRYTTKSGDKIVAFGRYGFN